MSDFYNAFDISPVPAPGPDAVAPELYRGIYGMPMFVTIPTTDIPASVDFWTRGLGFFELFAIPGQLVHLRRWAFQDVLLVPAGSAEQALPAMTVSFACVLAQIENIADAVRALDAAATKAPRDTAWNTRDIEVLTPENVRVVFTAAKPFDPTSEGTVALRAVGIGVEGGDNGEHV
ncbi:VOC family protein [Microbacterium sp. SORGH_AS_0862]|uniref:VOC family protein n=1 Tax=Microbacterium sp. SORGH_AS_0862 TaxID=3041789 RepID=UPI00278F69C6|nr:VOC family protein [Microbacterium sp. SORGH_AS_0862]MDQ1204901.1 catechol 2,3-dioxygenase-like lactoylglutathione lyase family enzyme [Microbacterium sp. SORGH_AS_0862]